MAVIAAANCTPNVRSVDAIAEGYVRATLQLAQHDPTLVEDWRGPQRFRPGPRSPVAEVAREIERLQRDIDAAASDIASAEELARVQYLKGQLRALQFAAERQLGHAKSIDDQAREEFGVTFPPLDREAIQRAHMALRDTLPGSGALKDRLRAHRDQTVVPSSRRVEVLTGALASCRLATTAIVELPRDESVAFMLGEPPLFDAIARYRGNNRTEIEISGGPLDSARAHRLACHEGYPGHHVQHLLIDRLYADRQWPELLLTPAFGPHLLYLEGAAEVGADLVLHASPIDRLLQELQPIVTDVARKYLDGTLTEERALERLADEALLTNPAGMLAFIEQRRARALVYVEGRRLVYEKLETKDLAGLYDAFRSVAALQ
ncbi:MAG TPA: hypothetical protein VJ691_16395 [Vicinamibacterales bacterium]|nr:hypothetical protein [Vicinamibacterales bacterium]